MPAGHATSQEPMRCLTQVPAPWASMKLFWDSSKVSLMTPVPHVVVPSKAVSIFCGGFESSYAMILQKSPSVGTHAPPLHGTGHGTSQSFKVLGHAPSPTAATYPGALGSGTYSSFPKPQSFSVPSRSSPVVGR